MSKWRYVLLERQYEDGEVMVGVYEVHLNRRLEPIARTEAPTRLEEYSQQEMQEALLRIRTACKQKPFSIEHLDAQIEAVNKRSDKTSEVE